jgi:hypothetical protein
MNATVYPPTLGPRELVDEEGLLVDDVLAPGEQLLTPASATCRRPLQAIQCARS